MKPSEIIKRSASKMGQDPDRLIIAIHNIFAEGKGFAYSKNNSVLVLINIGDGNFETHLYSEDSPLKLSQSMIYFFNLIKKTQGIEVIYGDADSPQIINLLKTLAKKEKTSVENPDKSGYNWMIRI